MLGAPGNDVLHPPGQAGLQTLLSRGGAPRLLAVPGPAPLGGSVGVTCDIVNPERPLGWAHCPHQGN